MKRPVLVRWRDAYAISATWVAKGDPIPDPVIVSTVGWIIDHDLGKDYVVIADSTYDTADGRYYGGVTVVPTAMVIERRKLE